MSDDSSANSLTLLLQDNNDCVVLNIDDMKPDNNDEVLDIDDKPREMMPDNSKLEQKPAKMRVIVLGKSGTGKSSLCNQLVRKEIEENNDESLAPSSSPCNQPVGKEREEEFDESSSSTSSSTPLSSSSSSPPLSSSSNGPFRVGSGLTSITTQCQQETVDKYDCHLTVVDTPSTDSTDNQQMISELKKQATKAGDKIILVFCVRSDARFAAEEYNIYKDLKNNWGDEKDFCRRLIVVFTHGDKLDEDEDRTQERRKKQQQIPEIQKPSEKKEEDFSSVEKLEKEWKEENKNEQEQVQKLPLEEKEEAEEEPECRETQATIHFIEERGKFAPSMPVRSSVQAPSVKSTAEITSEDSKQFEPCPSTQKDEDLGPRKSLTPSHKKGINYGSTEIAGKPPQRDDPFQQTPKFSSNEEGTPRTSEAAIYHKQAAEADAFQPMAAEKTSSTEHVTHTEKMIQEQKKSDADEPVQQNAGDLEKDISNQDSGHKEELVHKNKGRGDETHEQEEGTTKGASPTIDILPALTTFKKTKRELILDEKLKVTWEQLENLLEDAKNRYVLISNTCVDDRAVRILLDVAKKMNTDGQPKGLVFADSLEEPVGCLAVLLNSWEHNTELLVRCVMLCVIKCGPCFRRCRDCLMWCCRCCRRCWSHCRRWCDTHCCSCCLRCCRKYRPDCEDPRKEDIELTIFQRVG